MELISSGDEFEAKMWSRRKVRIGKVGAMILILFKFYSEGYC